MPDDSAAEANPRAVRVSHAVALAFFRSDSNPLTLKRDIRRWLLAILWCAVLVPTIFYLQFGSVGPLGWELTVFFCTYCLLSAIGLYFLVRPEYHSPVTVRNDWLDRVGAFWLVACGFGPFFGWVLTTTFPLTVGNWRWLYFARVFLSVGIPVLTASPLLRYVRGRGAPVMLAILMGVTALPIWAAVATIQDLRSGPNVLVLGDGTRYLHLTHTRRVLPQPESP